MKTGLITSAVAHAAVLTFGIVSLAAPKQLVVPDVDALPVDIVPYSELTKTVAGDKKAELSATPAPKPTTKPPNPEPAVNIGDSKSDIKAEAPKTENLPPVEKVQVPTAKPDPLPPREETPVSTPELAPEPKPQTDIAMLLKQSETIDPEQTVKETFEELPDTVATPKKRPERPKPDSAQTNERKDQEKPKQAIEKAAKEAEENDAKKKAVLDKAKASAGGAKSSSKPASLGAQKANSNSTLSKNELDAMRSALEGCFNAGDLPGHQDAATMRAQVTFKLTKSGQIEGLVRAKVTGTSGSTRAVFTRRVKNAVKECQPYSLPADKYDTWKDVVVNFSLTDLL